MDTNSLPKLKKQTLVEDFITRFEEMIISGKLSIGDKLPSERDLATRLGVSRPVVHEGLLDLAAKGLVARSSKGGAVINDYRRDGSLFMLNSLLNFRDGALEPKLAENTIEFRFLVEVENARLAAQKCTGEQLDAMRAILEAEKQAVITDYETIAQLDFEFHLLIAMATDNIFYSLLLNSFKPLYLNGVRLFYSNPQVAPEVFGFHAQLIEAFASHDEKLAVEVMHRMLEHGKTNYLKKVSKKA
jgi:GntR family transcriptional repressor for pyruvate dehydrogenase complex